MTLQYRFPEIFRVIRGEISLGKLIGGFFTVQLILGSLFLSSIFRERISGHSPGLLFFYELTMVQCLLLIAYGTQRTSIGISGERDAKTWDLQRLTPLTSFELTAGKLLGEPLFAYYLVLATVPWSLVAAFNSPELSLGIIVRSWALIATSGLFFLNLGLLLSAYSDRELESGTGRTTGVLVAVIGLFSVMPVFPALKDTAVAVFFGFAIPKDIFVSSSFLFFGISAFFAVKWKVGRDLLEPRGSALLPVFFFLLWAYIFGLTNSIRHETSSVAYLRVSIPAVLVYAVSFLNPEGRDHWRYWLSLKSLTDGEGREKSPVWLRLWFVLVCLSILTWVFSDELGAHLRVLILVPLFAGRDLMFLQWCRFTGARRPEVMALIYLAIAYILPPIVLRSAHVGGASYLLLPMVQIEEGFLGNVVPGFIQFLTMAGLLWFEVRSIPHKKGPPA